MNINNLLTKDNITLFLAIFGALGSLFLFIRQFLFERVNIDINIPGICEPERGSLIAYFSFTNKSHLPVSITGISIVYNNKLYPCEQIPDYIINDTYSMGSLPNSAIQNTPLPIFLPSLGAACGYVLFLAPSTDFQFPSKHLTVRLSTNRNQIVERTLEPESLLD